MQSVTIPDNYLDNMVKGDLIPRSEIEQIFDKQPYDNCDLLNLVEQLNKISKKNGTSLVFRTEWEKGSRGQVLSGIRALTDNEAAKYAQNLNDSIMRRIRKSLKVSQSVDVANLSDEEKRKHQINELVVGRRMMAMSALTRRAVMSTVPHVSRTISPFKRHVNDEQG